VHQIAPCCKTLHDRRQNAEMFRHLGVIVYRGTNSDRWLIILIYQININFPSTSHTNHGTGTKWCTNSPQQMFYDPTMHDRIQNADMFRRLGVIVEQTLTGSLPSSISQTYSLFSFRMCRIANMAPGCTKLPPNKCSTTILRMAEDLIHICSVV